MVCYLGDEQGKTVTGRRRALEELCHFLGGTAFQQKKKGCGEQRFRIGIPFKMASSANHDTAKILLSPPSPGPTATATTPMPMRLTSTLTRIGVDLASRPGLGTKRGPSTVWD